MAIRFSAAVTGTAVVAAAWGSLVLTDGSILRAQVTPAAATVTPPKFEVATIKRNVSGASGISDVFQPDGRYRASNMRLRDLVATAYRVRGFQIVGGPAWVASERFDVEAEGRGRCQLCVDSEVRWHSGSSRRAFSDDSRAIERPFQVGRAPRDT